MTRLVLVPIVFSLLAAAGTPQSEVEQTLASYRQSKTFKARVKKTITQELLSGEPTVSEGDFYFSKGRLRLEIEKPEPTTLVFDGKFIWFESRMASDDGEKIVVTKMKSQEMKKSDSLLAVLFDNKDILKTFKLVDSSKSGELKTYSFEPKDKKKSEVQRLELVLDPKLKRLQTVTYTDSIENKVVIEFLKTEKSKVSKSKFQYTPPIGADVTEM